jgi:hypothetical protein
MSDLYLVAHKVRGEPAFDIAEQLPCMECGAAGCHECDQLGYWWMIPTSGHRAYPYATIPLQMLGVIGWGEVRPYNPGRMPEGLPDHYPCNDRPIRGAPSLLDRLNLNQRSTLPPIVRRI